MYFFILLSLLCYANLNKADRLFLDEASIDCEVLNNPKYLLEMLPVVLNEMRSKLLEKGSDVAAMMQPGLKQNYNNQPLEILLRLSLRDTFQIMGSKDVSELKRTLIYFVHDPSTNESHFKRKVILPSQKQIKVFGVSFAFIMIQAFVSTFRHRTQMNLITMVEPSMQSTLRLEIQNAVNTLLNIEVGYDPMHWLWTKNSQLFANLDGTLTAVFADGATLQPVNFKARSGRYANQSYFNFCKNIICPNSYVVFPKSVQDIQSYVKEAIAKNQKIKAAGAGHSFNNVLCVEGMILRMEFFSQLISVDGNLAWVEAGVSVRALENELAKSGKTFAPFSLASYDLITLGGALGGGSHGSSFTHGAFMAQGVEAVEFVDGTGEIRIADESTPELLQAFRVNLGVLGIAVKFKIRIEDRVKVKGKLTEMPNDDLVLREKNPISFLQGKDFYQLYWYPNSQRLFEESHVVIPQSEMAKYKDLQDKTYIFDVPFSQFLIPLSEVLLQSNQDWLYCGVQGERMLQLALSPKIRRPGNVFGLTTEWRTHQGIGWADEMTSSGAGSPHDKTNENGDTWHAAASVLEGDYAFPLSRYHEVTNEVKRIIKEVESTVGGTICWPYTGVIIRFSKPFDALISQATVTTDEWKEGIFFIEFPVHLNTKKQRYRENFFSKVHDRLTKIGGRPHYSKSLVGDLEKANFEELYGENWQEFKRIREELDPNDIFVNDYAQRINLAEE